MLENAMQFDDWYIQQSRIMNKLDRVAGEYGVSFLQYNILMHIERCDCSSPTSIAAGMEILRTSDSRLLKSLQKKQLIRRARGVSEY